MCESNGELIEATEPGYPTSSDAAVTECPMTPGTTDETACGCEWETHGTTRWIGNRYVCAKCPDGSSDSQLKCETCPPGQENHRSINRKGRCFAGCGNGGTLTPRNVPSVLTCNGSMVLGEYSGDYGCYDCPAGLGRVENSLEYSEGSHLRVWRCYPQDKVSLECCVT